MGSLAAALGVAAEAHALACRARDLGGAGNVPPWLLDEETCRGVAAGERGARVRLAQARWRWSDYTAWRSRLVQEIRAEATAGPVRRAGWRWLLALVEAARVALSWQAAAEEVRS